MFGIHRRQRERRKKYRDENIDKQVKRKMETYDPTSETENKPQSENVKKEPRKNNRYESALEKAKEREKKKIELGNKKESAERESIQKTAAQQALEMDEAIKKAREEGLSRGREFLSQDMEGMTPSQRQNYEERASRDISRQMQGAQRKLAAQHSRSGVRGGAAYAQRADLERMGNEARQDYASDLNQMDQDLKLKKLAALFNIGEGSAAQSSLNRQIALDYANMENEKKRQRRIEDQMNQLFSRI